VPTISFVYDALTTYLRTFSLTSSRIKYHETRLFSLMEKKRRRSTGDRYTSSAPLTQLTRQRLLLVDVPSYTQASPVTLHQRTSLTARVLQIVEKDQRPTTPPTYTHIRSPSRSSDPSEASLPLTKENLRVLNRATMPDHPCTPKPSSKSTTTSASSKNVGKVRELLEDNNFFFRDDAAEERGKALIQTAKLIVKGDRSSTMKGETGRKLRAIVKEYGSDDELTFLVHFWRELIGDTRMVRETNGEPSNPSQNATFGPDPDPLQDRAMAIAWIEQAWQKDNLRCNWNVEFNRGSIPALMFHDDPVITKLLKDFPKIGNPKPDLTYGLTKHAFTERELFINKSRSKFTNLSNKIYHAFFAVEAKCENGLLAEAENQCVRAGTAMVHARRQFNQEADNRLRLGPDLSSFAFSLALHPSKAHMFVHWAECLSETKTVYHSHFIDTYDLAKHALFNELRHDINNVLDWGIFTWKKDIQDVYDKIADQTQIEKEIPSAKRIRLDPRLGNKL